MSFRFLIEHMPNCTPTQPCVSCNAVAFLKQKLNKEDYAQFLSIVSEANMGESSTPSKHDILDKPIEDVLKFDSRLKYILRREQIVRVRDLVVKTKGDLMRLSDFGERSLHQIQKELARVGLTINYNDE